MFRLRDARQADLDAFFELDQVCFPAKVAYSKAEFRSLLRSSRTTGLVAENGDAIAGFLLAQTKCYRDLKIGSVVTIDVAPQCRRMGVGRLLMSTLEARLRETSFALLRLEVAVDNYPALRFYECLGFENSGRIAGYYGGSLDAFVMEKRLHAGETLIG